MTKEEREVQKLFIANCKEFRKHRVKLDLDLGSCISLIALVQLALRHPGNKGMTAKWGTKFVMDLIEKTAVTPAMRTALLWGFDPERDVYPQPERRK
jgi:hypothetical protein